MENITAVENDVNTKLKINDCFKDVKRIRMSYHKDTCTISWPLGTDIKINDRKKKLHDSITRCYEHDTDFQDENLSLKTNMQLDRLDKFTYVDLKWEAIDLSEESEAP